MNPPNEPLSPDTGARLRGDDVLQTDAGLALRATRCKSCERATFPASTMCPFCLAPAPEAMPLRGLATLYSFTRVHVAPIRPGNVQAFFPEANALLSPAVREPQSGVPDYNAVVEVVPVR